MDGQYVQTTGAKRLVVPVVDLVNWCFHEEVYELKEFRHIDDMGILHVEFIYVLKDQPGRTI